DFASASDKGHVGQQCFLVEAPEDNVWAESFGMLPKFLQQGVAMPMDTGVCDDPLAVFVFDALTDVIPQVEQVNVARKCLGREVCSEQVIGLFHQLPA